MLLHRFSRIPPPSQLAILSKFADVVAQKLESSARLSTAVVDAALSAVSPPVRALSLDGSFPSGGSSFSLGSRGGGGGCGGGRGAGAGAGVTVSSKSFSTMTSRGSWLDGRCHSGACHPLPPLPNRRSAAAAVTELLVSSRSSSRAFAGAAALAGGGGRGSGAPSEAACGACPVPGLKIGSQLSSGSYGR
jgi:hypothetical protein